jgi:hypothetical protein
MPELNRRIRPYSESENHNDCHRTDDHLYFKPIGTRHLSRVECVLTNAGEKLMTSNGLEAGIGRGLEFLRGSQLPSGEFKVYVSPDLNL